MWFRLKGFNWRQCAENLIRDFKIRVLSFLRDEKGEEWLIICRCCKKKSTKFILISKRFSENRVKRNIYRIVSSFLRHIEGQPIPDTPGSEAIQLQTFPALRKGSSSHFSLAPSESPSDRRPDGAEEPDITTNSLYAERRSSRMSMTRSSDILSSHSKLQQIPEREPLIRRSVRYSEPQLSSPRNSNAARQKPQQKVMYSTWLYLNDCLDNQ